MKLNMSTERHTLNVTIVVNKNLYATTAPILAVSEGR